MALLRRLGNLSFRDASVGSRAQRVEVRAVWVYIIMSLAQQLMDCEGAADADDYETVHDDTRNIHLTNDDDAEWYSDDSCLTIVMDDELSMVDGR